MTRQRQQAGVRREASPEVSAGQQASVCAVEECARSGQDHEPGRDDHIATFYHFQKSLLLFLIFDNKPSIDHKFVLI